MKSSISVGGAPVASRSRSPHVSQPRRRLPTASMIGARGTLAQVRLQIGRRIVRVGQQMAAGEPLALVERLQDQRLFLRAHALERADAAVGAGASPDPRASGFPDRGRAWRRSWGRRPAGCSRSRIVAGNSASSSRWNSASPVCDDLADARRRGPCRCRESREARFRRAARARAGGWRRCRRSCGTRGS